MKAKFIIINNNLINSSLYNSHTPHQFSIENFLTEKKEEKSFYFLNENTFTNEYFFVDWKSIKWNDKDEQTPSELIILSDKRRIYKEERKKMESTHNTQLTYKMIMDLLYSLEYDDVPNPKFQLEPLSKIFPFIFYVIIFFYRLEI